MTFEISQGVQHLLGEKKCKIKRQSKTALFVIIVGVIVPMKLLIALVCDIVGGVNVLWETFIQTFHSKNRKQKANVGQTAIFWLKGSRHIGSGEF